MTPTGGLFITFEGTEGTGKTTQLQRLAERLRRAGRTVTTTREPGGTELGRDLRRLLLAPALEPMSPQAELLLYVADRAEHLAKVVDPALAAGAVVLCDRYVEATLAYQGYGRRLDVERIRALHRIPPLDRVPDRTLLFDLDETVSLSRARQRNRTDESAAREGRFEQERMEFHRRVRKGYLALAAEAPNRIEILDASGGIDEVEARVVATLRPYLPELEQDAPRC